MNKLLLALFLSLSANAFAGDVTYVGGGRHSCSGSDCESFNAIKNSGRYENVNPSGSTSVNDSTRDFIEDYDRRQKMEKYRNQLRSESEARRRRAEMDAFKERVKTMTDAEKEVEAQRLLENLRKEIDEIGRRAVDEARRGY
jgi:hypothetical protein